MNFVSSGGQLENYWNATGSVESWIRPGLTKANKETQKQIKTLLDGGELASRIQRDIDLTKLAAGDSEHLFSSLFHGGYVTAMNLTDRTLIRIPNREVHHEFDKVYTPGVDPDQIKIDHPFIKSIFEGDEGRVNSEASREALLNSSWSTGKYPEMAYVMWYHGLFSMALGNAGYQIGGEVEAGHGRADIFVFPKDNRGTSLILEFKLWNPKKKQPTATDIKRGLEASATRALNQIDDRKYFGKLDQKHYQNIQEVIVYGVACYKKHVHFKMAKRNPRSPP